MGKNLVHSQFFNKMHTLYRFFNFQERNRDEIITNSQAWIQSEIIFHKPKKVWLMQGGVKMVHKQAINNELSQNPSLRRLGKKPSPLLL